jgi:ADP-ribosylglycohydrolase
MENQAAAGWSVYWNYSLDESGVMGSVENPLNNSKGCGPLKHIAPVGLYYHDNMEKAFQVGVELSALTHGNPSAFLSSGFLASLISGLLQRQPMEQSVSLSLDILSNWENHHEVNEAVENALRAHKRLLNKRATVHDIKKMGAGWIAEEALSISLFCALHAQDDFRKGVLLAVNHSGDSDSTAAITGNLLGLILGAEKIPEKWMDKLLYKDIVKEIALKVFTKR